MVTVSILSALALNGLASAVLGWTTWTAYQSREQPSAIPFVLLLGTLTAWAVGSFGVTVPDVASADLLSSALELLQFGAALVVPWLWTVYVLTYTGRGTGLTRKRIALLAGIALPVAMGAVTAVVSPSGAEVDPRFVPLIIWLGLYLPALFLYGTYLLVSLGGNHARVSNTQVGILAVGTAAPYLSSLLNAAPTNVVNATVGLLIAGSLLFIAVRQYPVLTGFPKADYVARRRVVETLREALVVLDWDDYVLDVNETTVKLFDRPAHAMIGEPIGSVVDGLEETELFAGATGTGALRTSNGRRQFQFSVSAVNEGATTGEDDPVARTVLFRDITDRRTRQQRLTVLNRVLRHNVRNGLDVVLAYADHIDDEEVRTTIRARTTELLALSEKARDAEEIMTANDGSPEAVDVTDIVSTVAAHFRRNGPAGDITIDCPDDVVISIHRRVLRQVLEELVENALEHASVDLPRVEISVREPSAETVEISVADDGPGLPERERDILAAGTETQLKHGQGIGLWFVNWAVTRLGGDIQFQENDPSGSIITICLYTGTRRPPAASDGE